MGAASLQAELIYALLGFSGQVIVQMDQGRLGLADGLPIDPSERRLVLGILSISECYAALDRFLSAELFDWQRASVGRDPYMVALANGVDECLAPYRTRVLELEQQLLHEKLPITMMQLGVAEFGVMLPLMRTLVDRVRSEGVSAVTLLDLLSEAAAGAVGSGRQCIESILWHVQRVFLSQLSMWVLYGELLPAPSASFFIQRARRNEAAATTVNLTKVSPSAPALQTWRDEGWGEFEVAVQLKPRLLSMKLAERALFTGKAVRVLRAAEASGDRNAHEVSDAEAVLDITGFDDQVAGEPYFQRDATKPANSQIGQHGRSVREMRRLFASFTEELAELRTVRRLANMGEIDELIGRMASVASLLLWQHLHYECKLSGLLSALKGYFLLGRGELYHRLVLELRESMVALPSARLDLATALSHATSGAEPDVDGHMQRLRLFLPPAERGMSAYDAWRRLGLRLPIPFPLSLLVDAPSLEAYSELFSFLFTVKRVQMELHMAWASQMEKALPIAHRAKLLPVWQLRAHMAFLIDNLQYYLQVDVLDAQWQVLTEAAAGSKDFEALASTHAATLAALSSQCFLRAGSVSSALHQIFQLCLSLCRMIEHADVGLRDVPSWEAQVAMVRDEFSRQTAFLLAFLSNVSSPQASPHLGQLLLRLNFNEACSMLQAGSFGVRQRD